MKVQIPETDSIERSLQNCSLVNLKQELGREGSLDSSSGGEDLELKSHVSLPCHYEQCLDLKTGEIYYINWRNGSRSDKVPAVPSPEHDGYYCSDEDSSPDSDESSSESWKEECHISKNDNVLVVAGCKNCLMYFMVPKLVGKCPKCSAQLLHFDQSENVSP